MKLDLLDLICCPTCYYPLEVVGPQHELTIDRILRCTHCGAEYPVKKGMPFLHKNDETWEPKAREAQGWIELWKDQGIYERALDSEDSFKLPYSLSSAHNLPKPVLASLPRILLHHPQPVSLQNPEGKVLRPTISLEAIHGLSSSPIPPYRPFHLGGSRRDPFPRASQIF